jgi:NADH-quinone oxidoreductase subunit M
LPNATFFAATGIIFGAVYLLWLIERVFFGPTKSSLNGISDLKVREWLCLAPLLVLIVWMGVKPNFFLSKIELATAPLLNRLQSSRVTQQGVERP